MTSKTRSSRAGGPAVALPVLACAQFVTMLDSSAMNVSIAQVAQDVGTTVTGVQAAITFYTLVMAMLMIPGGEIGTMIGRRRAFAIGCVVYAVGSLVTALSPNLPVMILGWSILEGVGAALIMPAAVALVATNFADADKPRAYGVVAAAGAFAVAAGPLIGGALTTYATWRLVFGGEVVLVLAMLALTPRLLDPTPPVPHRVDLVGVLLSSLGVGAAVFGVLRAGAWGWVQAKPDAPSLWGLSATLWLVLGGLLVVRVFVVWEQHVIRTGRDPLVDLALFRRSRMTGGLTMFFFQFLIQGGLFFTIPLYLSVALGLSAVDTGVRMLPLSVTLVLATIGLPRLLPRASPRTVVGAGLLALLLGIASLIAALEVSADARIVTVPLLLAGLGIGALSSQLGAVTMSAVSEERSGEVGGLQNSSIDLGTSLGTALAGSVLIGALTASFVGGIQGNPAVPDDLADSAAVELASGVPFLSDAALRPALTEAGLPPEQVAAVVEENAQARVNGLRAALAVLALIAVRAIFLTRLLPTRPT